MSMGEESSLKFWYGEGMKLHFFFTNAPPKFKSHALLKINRLNSHKYMPSAAYVLDKLTGCNILCGLAIYSMQNAAFDRANV